MNHFINHQVHSFEKKQTCSLQAYCFPSNQLCLVPGCNERRRQRMPAVTACRLSPQRPRSPDMPRWVPSPSLRRRKPMKRLGKWPPSRSSSALRHELLLKKVSHSLTSMCVHLGCFVSVLLINSQLHALAWGELLFFSVHSVKRTWK